MPARAETEYKHGEITIEAAYQNVVTLTAEGDYRYKLTYDGMSGQAAIYAMDAEAESPFASPPILNFNPACMYVGQAEAYTEEQHAISQELKVGLCVFGGGTPFGLQEDVAVDIYIAGTFTDTGAKERRLVAHIAAPAEPAGLSIACDNEYTRNRILHFQRLDESGDYVDVPETEWGSLTPGAYCIQAATPVYIVDELSGPDHNVFYYRDTWKAYFFNGGIQKGQSSKLYTVGDYMFYFDLREGDGALTIQTDSDYPLATLTIEEGAPVDSIVLPISVDGEEIGVGISMPNDTIDPILLEEGRTYEVIASDKLVFTGATVTKTDVKYYPATYEPTYIYTISITENDGNGAVTIAKEPPVSITLSSGADAICEEYSMPGEGGWGWGGNGPYYSAGEYTFYEMGEELVITGAQDVSYDEDYTYTFTAAPGAVITIRLATESEDVFAPKATINLTAAAEALLTQWEYDNEGNIDWDGNVKYPVGEYAFTFSGEVEIDGVNNYDLRESEGQYIYTFTANANDIITIDVPVTTYTITVAGGIENGAVTANPTTAAENETVTLTVTLAAGMGKVLSSFTVTLWLLASVTVRLPSS